MIRIVLDDTRRYTLLHEHAPKALVMTAHSNGQAIVFYPLWFLSSSFFYFLLFSSPVLSRRRLDVSHTSTHDVALVRI